MERVGVLINKLNEQLQQSADVNNMLVTVQLLQNELIAVAANSMQKSVSNVSVTVPKAAVNSPKNTDNGKYKPVPKPEPEPVPIVEPVTEEPKPEIPPLPSPEPEPIPHFVEQDLWKGVYPHKQENNRWPTDPVLEIPTLAHQEKTVYELNDTMVNGEHSLNDRLKENKTEVSAKLQDIPVHDLKKAININERHRFINELFRGDETMYERSIKTINSFGISAEAEYWIQRELKVKLGWNSGEELVKTFDQLVKRRFG